MPPASTGQGSGFDEAVAGDVELPLVNDLDRVAALVSCDGVRPLRLEAVLGEEDARVVRWARTRRIDRRHRRRRINHVRGT